MEINEDCMKCEIVQNENARLFKENHDLREQIQVLMLKLETCK